MSASSSSSSSSNGPTLVREYMHPSVVSVTPETSLVDVLRALNRNNVSSVLVAGDTATAPSGMISMTDLLRVVKQRTDEETANEKQVVVRPLPLMPPGLKASDVMKKDLITVPADATVGEAAAKLLKHSIQRVFVTEAAGSKKVVGVFSTRDALRVVLARHIETPLKDVMTSPVVTVSIGETIDAALEKLDDSNLRGLAVVDIKVPVGLFTQLEAIKARALPARLRARPVEEVMSYETTYLDVSTPLYRAAGHGVATEVRRILVTEQRALVGIVTGYDLAKVLI
jgi:CBS domain-containing protein